MRGDQQIVAADLVSRSFKSSAQLAVNAFNRRFDCQYFDRSKDGIDLRGQPIRVALYGAVPQLGCDDDARANRPIPDFHNLPRGAALRIPNNVRENVRIEEIPHLQMNRISRQLGDQCKIVVDRRKRLE